MTKKEKIIFTFGLVCFAFALILLLAQVIK